MQIFIIFLPIELKKLLFFIKIISVYAMTLKFFMINLNIKKKILLIFSLFQLYF